jgi:NADPH:quinone reductase-like Zn-dependent oxidoreductase
MRGYITDPSSHGGLRLADDLLEPEPALNELLLEVHAYSVNRGELFLLQQRPDGWRPGQDVAGVVVRAAGDGSGPAEGERVVGIVDGAGWSERVPVLTRWAARLPEAVSFAQGASLPIAGLTALRALRVDGPLLGRRVLVTGATGGVGQFGVQLAVTAGARVTALVRTPAGEELVRALGAHEVVTSLDDDLLGPFDLVLEGVGGTVLQGTVHRLAPGGAVVAYGAMAGPTPLSFLDFRSAPLGKVVGLFHGYPEETKGADIGTLADLVGDGRLEPLLGLVRDWEETREVLEALRNGNVRGKAVLTRE